MKRTNVFPKLVFQLCLIIFAVVLSGCASTPKNPEDPWEDWNRGTQKFNDNVDDYVMKPVAKGYQYVTPEVVDESITNFFSNLKDIGVTVNDLLQLKFKQGGMDAGRFLVNSTVGVVGLIDVASMIDLPKHNEDFGQTLGVWGVPSGPYLVLPFIGPSSPRGAAGLVGDAVMHPLTYTFLVGGSLSTAASAAATGARSVEAVDKRADFLKVEKVATEAAIDRYAYFREAYKQRRKYLIYDGNVPEGKEYNFDVDIDIDDELDDLEKSE